MRLIHKPRVHSAFIIMPVIVVAFLATAYFYATQFAHAAGEPAIVGGSAISGQTDRFLPIEGVELEGDIVGDVPVSLSVDSGTLKMSVTTGLTFSGASSGRTVNFTGSKTNVNNALATLAYRSNAPSEVEFTARIGSADMVYYPGNGHVYEVVTPEEGVNWDEANTLAQARTFNGASGYLATITDQDENDYITARMAGDGWFGASDVTTEGDWRWVTGPEAGTPFWSGLRNGSSVDGAFSNWADGEPNDYGEGEDCAQFYGSGSGWNDLPCGGETTLPSYVVEYGADGDIPTPPSSTSFSITTETPEPATVSIGSCEAFFSELEGKNDHRYDTINVTQNLDCTGYTLTSLFSEFDYDAERPLAFEGTFNGNGYTISNLSVEAYYDEVLDDMSPAGLFAYTKGATIRDLTLTNLSVAGNYCVGGVVGQAQSIALSGVSVSGTVGSEETQSNAGGLVGCLYDTYGDSEISDSAFSGSIMTTGGSSVGGAVGLIQMEYGNSIELTEIETNVTIEGSYSLGGIIGGADMGASSRLRIYATQSDATFPITSNSSGGVAGRLNVSGGADAELSNNTVLSAIEGDANIGGVVGRLYAYDDTSNVLIATTTINQPVTSTQGYTGGVIGTAEVYTYDASIVTIQDVLVAGAVSGMNAAGGIAGNLYGYREGGGTTILIDKARVTGSVTSSTDSQAGGLVGYAVAVLITKSYATGAIAADGSSRLGGLVGYATDVTIQDSYARGSVAGGTSLGGLVGYADGTVTAARSYATGAVANTGDTGGLIGEGTLTAADSYWDVQTTGQATSAGGQAKTTSQMMQLSTYADWDFNTVWAKSAAVNNGYPCLRWTNSCSHDQDTDGVGGVIEGGAPNSGDANYDGLPDAEQSNVTSLISSVTGNYVTLEVDDTCSLSDVSVAAEDSIATRDARYQYTNGLINFNADCGDPGVTISVKQYYYGVSSVRGLVARKFNPNTQEYKTVTGNNVSLTAQPMGGQTVVVLSYTITDGDDLDTDGAVNGTIVDPIGLASTSAGAPNTGLFRQGTISGAIASVGVGVLVSAFIASAVAGGIVLVRRRADDASRDAR